MRVLQFWEWGALLKKKLCGFQRFTELVQRAACLLIAPDSIKLLSSVLTVSPIVPITRIASSVAFCRVMVSALVFCHYLTAEPFFLILVHEHGRE